MQWSPSPASPPFFASPRHTPNSPSLCEEIHAPMVFQASLVHRHRPGFDFDTRSRMGKDPSQTQGNGSVQERSIRGSEVGGPKTGFTGRLSDLFTDGSSKGGSTLGFGHLGRVLLPPTLLSAKRLVLGDCVVVTYIFQGLKWNHLCAVWPGNESKEKHPLFPVDRGKESSKKEMEEQAAARCRCRHAALPAAQRRWARRCRRPHLRGSRGTAAAALRTAALSGPLHQQQLLVAALQPVVEAGTWTPFRLHPVAEG